jgi:RsiW-degrading membrane proteinase PrsW (M82 family)
MPGWVLAIVLGAAPSLFVLTFFYLRDRWEREPMHRVAMAFGLGLYAMAAARGLAFTVINFLSADWLGGGTEGARLFESFVLAAFIEETSKAVVLFACIYHWDDFDEPLDGVVYGVAVSLGFATLENVLYILQSQAGGGGLTIVWQRALFSVPAHALFGGAMGYYAGKAKFDRTHPVALALDRTFCLAVPILFHGGYNFALHHRLDTQLWAIVTAISLGMWVFVLRRVHRADRASPFRPRTGANPVGPDLEKR